MENYQKTNELKLVLFPWISWAYSLIQKKRLIGGNGFRHGFSVLGILIDHKYKEGVLLKCSLIHDIVEDIFTETPEKIEEMRSIDEDGNAVVDLLLEVSKRKDETKIEYLKRLRDFGSTSAKIIKTADRIDNVCDTNRDIWSTEKIREYLQQTTDYVLPMALDVNKNMYDELVDLIKIKTAIINSIRDKE
jgi:hypothetical protein